MRPTSLESASLLTALDSAPQALERPREPLLLDPRAARFGQLFAKVFGEQTRQPIAGGPSAATARSAALTSESPTKPVDKDGADVERGVDEAKAAMSPSGLSNEETDQESEAALRALQIGESTEIITAGLPPSDEDLLRYARDASMDEGSVAALLRHGHLVEWVNGGALAPSDPEGKPDRGASTTENNVGTTHTAQEALILRTLDPLRGSMATGESVRPVGLTALMGTLQASTDPESFQGGGVNSASESLSVQKALQSGRPEFTKTSAAAAPSGHLPSLSGNLRSDFTVVVSTNTVAQTSAGAATLWLQSRQGGMGEFSRDTSGTETEHGLSEVAGVLEEGPIEPRSEKLSKFDFEALRLRLGLQDQSAKDRLERLLGPEAVRALETGKPDTIQLDPINLAEFPTEVMLPIEGYDKFHETWGGGETDGLTTALSGGAGSPGQGGGDGARPDTNSSGQAAQPRTLPQQIMQRFGELLSQRLLQQVSQGTWRVELDLEPGDLGSIRIELEMRKGEIEASIKASQASTRDLLQESLPRLRDALERNGMDVASILVSQQDRRQSGGHSPSGRQASKGQSSGEEQQSSGLVAASNKSGTGNDGRLDVWV